MEKGMLIVIAGPRGVGNDALARMVAADVSLNAERAISATTRSPREFEKDKRDFHFTDRETFNRAFQLGMFLETDVIGKAQFGTLKSEVINRLNNGLNVIVDCSVHGATSLIRKYDCERMLSVLVTPSEAEYRRILNRAGITILRTWITKFRDDNMFRGLFDCTVESDNLQASADAVRMLIHNCLANGGKTPDLRKGTVIKPEGADYSQEEES